jgi:cytochrome P450
LTTANTLTWTLFLLAQHPLVASALYAELTRELHGKSPELSQLERLPLLDRVIKESMRVLPASSYSQRINVEPVELGPLLLSTGTLVIFSQFITHHLPEQFPEPYRFLPQRWESIDPSPYAYLPFATGPKMCIGATLAMMTIRLTVSTVWQRARLAVVPGANINGMVTSTMLGPTTGMPMTVLDADAPFESHPVRGNINDLVYRDTPIWTRRAA